MVYKYVPVMICRCVQGLTQEPAEVEGSILGRGKISLIKTGIDPGSKSL